MSAARPIRTVLIANRGEIAVRIARTLREMGRRSVAVYSEADAGAPHVAACDVAVPIGPPPATESYLRIAGILDAARKTGADAIHPGYGFLSQNPEFAEACAAADVTFIGPTPAATRALGDKAAARALAEKAGVPVAPGTGALADAGAVAAAARKLGAPVMLKAAAGGGGKGMRKLLDLAGLDEAIGAARREAEAAFGDGRLLVERLITSARHVEVQVVGDVHGRVVAFGERDCTLQRRFQKIIEEAPSPAVTPAIRAKLCDAACRLAAAAGYTNAGTLEFLLAPDGTFSFLEMNTRLQVEHPVTEAVIGVDLVRLQIEVAEGQRLTVDPPAPRGHAIEARVYAEKPSAGFLPASGTLLRVAFPGGVRVDHALAAGVTVTPHYDPLLAKVIAWAPDREHARRRLLTALRETVLLGVETNVTWLGALLDTPAFRTGDLATDRLPEVRLPEPPLALFAAAALAAGAGSSRVGAAASGRMPSAFETLGGWRQSP